MSEVVDELLLAREHLLKHEKRLRELASEISQSIAGRRYHVFYLHKDDIYELNRALEEVREAIELLSRDAYRYSRDYLVADAIDSIASYLSRLVKGLENVHRKAEDIIKNEKVADVQISATTRTEYPSIELRQATVKIARVLGSKAKDIIEHLDRLSITRDTTITNYLRELAVTLREIARKLRLLEM